MEKAEGQGGVLPTLRNLQTARHGRSRKKGIECAIHLRKILHPDQFAAYREIAYAKGFEHVPAGPLVRSSYHAGDYHPAPI